MISIVTAYYQRKDLLDKTLESIDRSRVQDYELIIVDDASPDPLVCERAKVIRIEPKDKWYHNPCIPFNMGFREAKGDIVVIQNPECYHVGDVLAYVEDNIQPNDYISFECYAINKKETEEFHQGKFPVLNNWKFRRPENNGWYNHKTLVPVGYHFCSAIRRNYLNAIGGFDERYAHGVAFDDNAFIRTIKRWELNVRIVNPPYVIHQFHTHFKYDDPKIWIPLHNLNGGLYATT
jgi:glycosyltransferase involved in cell wall biosynthesis